MLRGGEFGFAEAGQAGDQARVELGMGVEPLEQDGVVELGQNVSFTCGD